MASGPVGTLHVIESTNPDWGIHPQGLNNAGVVVGVEYLDNLGIQGGFAWEDGHFTPIPPLFGNTGPWPPAGPTA